jgi:pimeloyl-ACP methyl ester carboxylesterase
MNLRILSADFWRRNVWQLREWGARALPDPDPRITFRFGLAGRRYGEHGPIVLWVDADADGALPPPEAIAALRDAGLRVLVLDGAGGPSGVTELALAIQEAAAELPALAAIAGHGEAAAAVALALTHGGLSVRRALLFAPPAHAADGAAGAIELARIARATTTPALIVHDRDDAVVPLASGEALAAAWPGARLLATRGLGHREALVDAGVLAQVVRLVAGDDELAAAPEAPPARRRAGARR